MSRPYVVMVYVLTRLLTSSARVQYDIFSRHSRDETISFVVAISHLCRGHGAVRLRPDIPEDGRLGTTEWHWKQECGIAPYCNWRLCRWLVGKGWTRRTYISKGLGESLISSAGMETTFFKRLWWWWWGEGGLLSEFPVGAAYMATFVGNCLIGRFHFLYYCLYE